MVPDWVIQRQVLDYPRYSTESKALGLQDPFCLIRNPFTFRRYPGFSIPRHRPQWHLTAIWKGKEWEKDQEEDEEIQLNWLKTLRWVEL